MRALLLVLMFILAGPAGAALVGIGKAGDIRIEFYDEQGTCPSKGLARVVMVEPNGNATEGCWVENADGEVFIAMNDGRVARGHRRMIKPPSTT
jgi:hypothetical protein